MIPKLDSYIYGMLNKYVPLVTSSANFADKERYIIQDALGGLESTVSDTFINTFCLNGENKKSIDISYEFPKQKEQVDARYVISLGGLEESSDFLGSTTGVGDEGRPANGENIVQEVLPVKQDSAGLFFELSNPILELLSIDEVASLGNFVDYSKGDDDPNRVNLRDSMTPYVGANFTIHYYVKDDGVRKDYGGVDLGFSAKERVVVEAVSNNLDTVRCMYALLKYILIIARSSSEEGNYIQLQQISSSGLQIAQLSPDDLNDIAWVFPVDIEYKVDYQVRNDSLDTLNKISIEGMGSND